MRADYVNTLALIGMAETLCKPLESDHEGLSRHRYVPMARPFSKTNNSVSTSCGDTG